MIKILTILYAVTLMPFYNVIQNDDNYTIDSETDIYFVYDTTLDKFGGYNRDANNPLTLPVQLQNYSMKVHCEEYNSFNQGLEVTGYIEVQVDNVEPYDSVACEFTYGDIVVYTACYSANYYQNEFKYGFNTRLNNQWTISQQFSSTCLNFTIYNDDLCIQSSLKVNFYAYKQNKSLELDTSYNDGYNDGYDVGFDDGQEANGFTLDWLTKGVAGFLDVDLFGTFGIGDILLLFLGAFLMIYLLKVFAGG